MAGETILVLDGDQEMEQRMTAPLEAKGYLVFTASSQLLSAESLDKLSPSLIYIKPLSPSAAGLEPCKAIHAIPTLKDVPIVLVASLKGSSDPRHLKSYGIVDFLRPQFGPEELIEMTETILGKTGLSQSSKKIEMGKEEPARDSQAARHAARAEDQRLLTDEEFLELTPSENRVPTAVNDAWAAGEEEQDMKPAEESAWSKTRKEKKRPAPFSPLIGIGIIVVIAGGGFLAYQQFFAPTAKVQTVRPATAPAKPRATPSETKASPASKAAETSAPASAGPSAPAASAPSTPSAASATPPAPTPQAPTSAASTASAKPPVSTAPATTAPVPASQTSTSVASATSTKPPAAAAPAKTTTSPAPTPQVPTSTASTTPTKPSTAPARTTPAPAPTSQAPTAAASATSAKPPVPIAPAKTKPFFSVQVGAFKNEVHAQDLMKTLKEKGYDAFVQQGVTKGKSPIYRVLVSKYEDRKAAESLAKEMQSKEKIKTALYFE